MDSGNEPRSKPRLVAVIGDECTGCQSCVEYCLVDCIEPTSPKADTPPIQVREDECIGCFVCAKVCEELSVNAIHFVPAGTGAFPTDKSRS
jgi:Pyruvate/2-oxoacid:ferredoxin oxidoreductase delta subunit